MSDILQALCLCGHGRGHHRDATGECWESCVHDGKGHSCQCKAFDLWDQRSERNEFAKAALMGIGVAVRQAIEKAQDAGQLLNVIYRDTATQAFDLADAMLAEAKRRDAQLNKSQ